MLTSNKGMQWTSRPKEILLQLRKTKSNLEAPKLDLLQTIGRERCPPDARGGKGRRPNGGGKIESVDRQEKGCRSCHPQGGDTGERVRCDV
jgi:hypothetical protein